MTIEEAIKTLKENSCNICGFCAKNMESCEIAYCDNRAAIRTLEQELCKMSAEKYRQRMMQVFHNANCDELIALCVLPEEKEFKHLEWLLKNYYKQEPCEDCISRADALRVAKNEYLRGWHNALCKALSEKYSIHCEEGNFNVIQEETITGLGLSMDCAAGKDVESYMSTIPSVTPTISEIDKFNDSVNRATVLALINDVKNADGFKDYSQYEYLFDQVDKMPMATPTRKKGKWITKIKSDLRNDMWSTNPKCSECGGEPYYYDTIYNYNFCPYCGAEMKESEEEE